MKSNSKIAAIHQPDFLSYIGFFKKMSAVDTFIYLDNVQIARRGWTHRDRIKTKNGFQWININLQKFKRDEILKRFNFASPYVELPKKLTVKQNLEIYGRLYGLKNLNKRINEISVDLGIAEFFNRKTGELSSGQKNRVSLAKSLIKLSKIFLSMNTLPPYFITIISFLYFSTYFKTSSTGGPSVGKIFFKSIIERFSQ